MAQQLGTFAVLREVLGLGLSTYIQLTTLCKSSAGTHTLLLASKDTRYTQGTQTNI